MNSKSRTLPSPFTFHFLIVASRFGSVWLYRHVVAPVGGWVYIVILGNIIIIFYYLFLIIIKKRRKEEEEKRNEKNI